MPDALLVDPHLHRAGNAPHLPERFLAPEGFVWGRFMTADGAVLRWGHLPVRNARAECVIAGGFGDFIEMHFETVRDLAARGFGVLCFDWRGQGGSVRPERWPARPRARQFDRDAADLGDFVTSRVTSRLPRVLIAHSMGGAIALLCLAENPGLFDAAVLSAPMFGLRLGRLPPTALRCVTGPLRYTGLGAGYIPGTPRWRKRVPTPATSRVSSDAERCRLRYSWQSANPALRLGRPTYGWLDTALGLIARIGKPEFLASIATPTLIGIAGREVVVSVKAQRRVARLLPNCTVAELRESKHQPFLEGDAARDAWLDHIDRFLGVQLSR
jgi:lysophospholipase